MEPLADHANTHFTIGDPLDPSVTMGPMASEAHLKRVMKHIETTKKSSARLIAGGGRPSGLDRGYFVEPTVFADVSNDDKLALEEVFGPVMAVMPFDDEADAVRLANETNFGLAAVVYSEDEDHTLRVARQLRSGTVGLNYYLLDIGAPFGGYKESGIGRELGGEIGCSPTSSTSRSTPRPSTSCRLEEKAPRPHPIAPRIDRVPR